MRRFKNIVLIYECDRGTLDRAIKLAKINRARLTVVQVVYELPERWRRISLGGTTIDLQKLAIKEYQSRLKDFVAPLKREGLRASFKLLVGTPFLEIIREVIAHKRDLVILTAEGESGIKERLFGRLSLHLMRKCPCPVWGMKPKVRKRFPRVLAAIDPDPNDQTRNSLNAKILEIASSLAVQDYSELHVIHAWKLPYQSMMRGRGGFTESEIRNYARSEEKEQRKALNELLLKYTDGNTKLHLIEGEPETVIPEFAMTNRVAVLVMGTLCRTGIPGFFIGNTAEKILDEVDCSVLTVKPDGFVSPVKPA